MYSNDLRVFLLPGSTYQQKELSNLVDKVLSAADFSNLAGTKVLLKPNLVCSRKGSLPCTEADFMLAVARWFVDNGATVELGDSPAFGSAQTVLSYLGVLEELKKTGVKIRRFKNSRKVILTDDIEAKVATAALDCDLLLNLPRVKAHSQLLVTMAIKNTFGCICGFQKPIWHMKHGSSDKFVNLILELVNVLPPVFSLVDGIKTMHKTGPIKGKPFALGLVAGGWNPLAIDMALLEIIGVEYNNSPLHRVAVSNNITGANREDLIYPYKKPHDLKNDKFRVATSLDSIVFNPFSFMRGLGKRVAKMRN